MSALHDLAAQLRDEGTPISAHVRDPGEEEEFATQAGEHAPVIEAVREGYLLHYSKSRLLAGHDQDLALLAGDYLYALGIERLTAMGDTKALLVLADLISSSAQLHAEGRIADVASTWQRAIGELSAP